MGLSQIRARAGSPDLKTRAADSFFLLVLFAALANAGHPLDLFGTVPADSSTRRWWLLGLLAMHMCQNLIVFGSQGRALSKRCGTCWVARRRLAQVLLFDVKFQLATNFFLDSPLLLSSFELFFLLNGATNFGYKTLLAHKSYWCCGC